MIKESREEFDKQFNRILEESEKQYFQEFQLKQAVNESLKMEEDIINADITETLKYT